MTKLQAIKSFLSGFGLKAYHEGYIYAPDVALPLPYITYSVQFDNYRGGLRPFVVTAWYRTNDPQPLEEFESLMAQRVGIQGTVIHCDGGYILIKRGTPFAQFLDVPADKFVKRVIINLLAEYNTAI
jgi:hypothetical protein